MKNYLISSLFLLSCVLCITTGCSSLPNWLGGEEKPKLKGERIAIIQSKEMLKPEYPEDKAQFPVPEIFNNWLQSDFPHTNIQGKQGSFFSIKDITKVKETAIAKGFLGNSFTPMSLVIAQGYLYSVDVQGVITAHLLSNPSKALWSTKITDSMFRSFDGALLFDDNILYITTGYNSILALHAETGSVLWKRRLPHNFHGLPAVSKDLVYVTTLDNHSYALEKKTGETRWTHGGTAHVTTRNSKASPLLVKNMLIIPYASGELFALEAESGKELWVDAIVSSRPRWWLEYNFNSIIAPPLSDGSHIFTLNSEGLLVAHAVETGLRVWEKEIAGASSPWIAGNRLFLVTEDNFLVSLSTKNGKIDWLRALPSTKHVKKKKNEKYTFWKGPLFAQNQLWLFSPDNELWSFSVDQGKELGHIALPHLHSDFPFLIGDKMIIFTDKMITLGRKASNL